MTKASVRQRAYEKVALETSAKHSLHNAWEKHAGPYVG